MAVTEPSDAVEHAIWLFGDGNNVRACRLIRNVIALTLDDGLIRNTVRFGLSMLERGLVGELIRFDPLFRSHGATAKLVVNVTGRTEG